LLLVKHKDAPCFARPMLEDNLSPAFVPCL
jgi:hypothetical protein